MARRLPYTAWITKVDKLLTEMHEHAPTDDEGNMLPGGDPDWHERYSVQRFLGEDDEGPVYDSGDALKAAAEKEPGTYRLVDKEGAVIAECILGASGHSGRVARVSSDPTLALNRQLNAIGDQWGQVATFQRTQLTDIEATNKKLRKKCAELEEENRALKDAAAGRANMTSQILELLPKAYELYQSMRTNTEVEKALPQLLKGLDGATQAKLIESVQSMRKQNIATTIETAGQIVDVVSEN